ncbi:hypothetical protein VF21_09864 [Pseudogymnoascus sp. 05NY08]|nr:hypothetical protein VF21_09864 [Pseudogymnoascus sp. 05NY08]
MLLNLHHEAVGASSPLGPWMFRGIVLDIVSSTTSHPGVYQLGDEWFITYHTRDALGGTHFRRSIAFDKLTWDDTTSPPSILNKRIGRRLLTLQLYWIKVINDERVEANPLPPDYWCSYAAEQSPETSTLTYEWDTAVDLNGATMAFFADQPPRSNVGVPPPASWKLEYLTSAGSWTAVSVTSSGAYPTTVTDSPEKVSFQTVSTTFLRAVLKASGSGGQFGGIGVKEWAALVPDAQVLASLKPAGGTFDFLPFDYLPLRAKDGQYHWGDITFRYRTSGSTTWVTGDSSKSRKQVTTLSTGAMAASGLAPTVPTGPLNITREWIDVSGDLGLQFTIVNSGSSAIEIGGLGFPAEFNSIFTNRQASDMLRLCSLSDPYIGMHAGQIRVAPTSGDGPALVVTPIGDTPMEAYRNLAETYYEDTAYGSQVSEGFYEWQVLSKAWAENEWSGKEPWNEPSSRTLQPGGSLKFGLRFSVAQGGVRDLDSIALGTGTPVAHGVPGYIIPRGTAANLFLEASSAVNSTTVKPAGALTLVSTGDGHYTVTPSTSAWGRVRLTVTYADGKVQTIHYYVTKPGTEAVASLGQFPTTDQWFTDTSDPFGRAPSAMTYNYEERSIVKQDSRAWVASLSDEGGAGSFLAACMKQAAQPNEGEITKLESFVDGVLWKTIQTSNFAVRKSIFFYEPSAVPGAMKADVGYNKVGLMGETVFGEILADLTREGLSSQAKTLTAAMKSRADLWNTEAVPFGSEMAWDSTGQEGVYYWSKYFGYSSTITKTVNSVLGFMPTVPHWGWNGNARRYWDNIYGGKLRRIERQIHHYGSGLNSLVLLGAFRSDPSDSYLLRVGYGGTSGPVSNINEDGFAAASFHSWRDTLKWDGLSGDYGPNFVVGLVAYGGVLTSSGDSVSVQTADPVKRRIFIGPLGVLITVDAGIINNFSYVPSTGEISVTLSQLSGVPAAANAVLWAESTTGARNYSVTTSGITEARLGWQIHLSSDKVTVQLA